ncbi:MAG: sulfhydrogenase subunit delta [Gammaproteobacteria bacterium]
MTKPEQKIRIAVHKFSSCDGCQLAFINHISELLKLNDWIDIIHFAEAGPCKPDALVDIAFIEGSISSTEDFYRLQQIRQQSQKLVTIGACATSGGIQALRNMADHGEWTKAVYAKPEYINSLAQSTPISDHVSVDHEIWGCPINYEQLFHALNAWLMSSEPEPIYDSVCTQCKAQGNTCVMLSQNQDCLGPVTLSGCGALCPSMNRACYACFGPASYSNGRSLADQFMKMGFSREQIAQRFLGINSQSNAFLSTALALKSDE